jgi:hypothetical protein
MVVDSGYPIRDPEPATTAWIPLTVLAPIGPPAVLADPVASGFIISNQGHNVGPGESARPVLIDAAGIAHKVLV